ncbi:TPM domain-containing protein [Thiobacter aerophilum]|uniref:TPM domain-containing protein n=1 Tax=Thiobacter aerophilum TaxID=3121275 RepID=A0ABV0EBS4_9BURK
MKLARLLRHLVFPPWWLRVRFPRRTLMAIKEAIRASEQTHRGQIRFAVEASLPLPALLRDITPRRRGLEVFAQLGVWDTEENNGVLIYVLLADRDVEIVADRGIARHVPVQAWQAIARRMESAFRQGRFEEGALAGIAAVGGLLARHFPASGTSANELPDWPLLL